MVKKRRDSPEDFEQQLDQLQQKIDRLRVLYDQYFMGIEKTPPMSLNREVVRKLHEFSQYHIKKTTHKFRYSSLLQRFSVNKAYWMRVERQMEDGTRQRDRDRATRRHLKRTGEVATAAEMAKRTQLRGAKGDDAVDERRQRMLDDFEQVAAAAGGDSGEYVPAAVRGMARRQKHRRKQQNATAIRGASSDDLTNRVAAISRSDGPDQLGTTSPSSAQAKPTQKTGSHQILSDAGMLPGRTQELYTNFLSARERSGQSVKNLNYEKIVDSMARQVSKVKKSHGASEIDFEVVTKKGKVFLKPRPK